MTALTRAELERRVALLAAYGGNFSEAAAAIGVTRMSLRESLKRANSLGIVPGKVAATKANVRPLPAPGGVSRYILTCAQADTKLHEPTWNALQKLAKHYRAEVMVSTYTYNKKAEGSAKRGTQVEDDRGLYDVRIEPFVQDVMVQLAPKLVWNGHMNILPTAVKPLSGLDNYNGRQSSVFPHAKVAMKSVHAMRSDPAKLQFTTGTVTQLNYIQKKAGQKAEFDHVFGALLVEVDSSGHWWARQLITDSAGSIHDLDIVVRKDDEGHYMVENHDAYAVTWGDIHVAHLQPEMYSLCWGPKGIVSKLKPKFQFMHDVLDFESRGHHNRKDPLVMFQLHAHGRESVQNEVNGVEAFLRGSVAEGCQTVVVDSNHDRHLERWLKEADWTKDLINAEFYVNALQAFFKSVRRKTKFNALEWAVGKIPGVRFLAGDESFRILKAFGGGIECSFHGDRGPGGAKGNLENLSKLGVKVNIGHSHGAGIFNGAYQAGLMAKLLLPYGEGAPSNWTHSLIVTHQNAKRQMVTIYGGKWRA